MTAHNLQTTLNSAQEHIVIYLRKHLLTLLIRYRFSADKTLKIYQKLIRNYIQLESFAKCRDRLQKERFLFPARRQSGVYEL